MLEKDIIKNAIINALLTALYITLIASFLFNTPKIFGPTDSRTVLIPILMLSLLVLDRKSVV